MPGNIVVRVQSPFGTKRIETASNESTCKLFEKVHATFNLPSFDFLLCKERNRKGEINSSRGRNLSSYKINHGDMLYLYPLSDLHCASTSTAFTSMETDDQLASSVAAASSSSSSSASSSTSSRPSSQEKTSGSNGMVIENEVDLLLQKMDGRVERPRDDKYCQHGTNSKCVHCSSIEPYDEKYLHEQKIKHLSFHSYLRKLSGGADKGKFVALENISCQIKPGCKAHLPWPKGICSKCQPNAVILNRQVYRHLDNVVFENPQLVERFLDYWRFTGHQRIGFLFGRYDLHKDVPLGIKATVSAIYEPPQESTRDAIRLLPDEKIDVVKDIARHLGLTMVGWIFTDLIADDVTRGTVKHFRNVNSHFLGAEEVIMAGHLQNQNPNPCRLSPTGFFGSKFVTVCVTGDAQNQVHMEGYQVSNQCMALVRDNCLVPTRDAPELAYVRESTNEQYVPDVFYKEKDEYCNEVTQLARLLPIEYLLLDVPVSTPMEPQFTFRLDAKLKPFPVENRMVAGHIQDFGSLTAYLDQFSTDQLLEAASDLHFLIYIASMEMLPMKDSMSLLLEAVATKDAGLAREWAKSENWATLEQLMVAHGAGGSAEEGGVGGGGASGSQFTSTASLWTCIHCTFLNQPTHNNCEICGLPR